MYKCVLFARKDTKKNYNPQLFLPAFLSEFVGTELEFVGRAI